MPVYEYACTACGERTEARQSFDDPPLEECQVCGGKLRKLYSPVGVVFKGSGFYATDARKSSTSGKGDGPADKSSDKSSDKADTKPKSDTSKSDGGKKAESAGSGTSSS